MQRRRRGRSRRATCRSIPASRSAACQTACATSSARTPRPRARCWSGCASDRARSRRPTKSAGSPTSSSTWRSTASTHVPEGEMVRLLEREGLAFGADTNASTGFETTTYKLDLPRNDPELLDTALMLMRETASELTFVARGGRPRDAAWCCPNSATAPPTRCKEREDQSGVPLPRRALSPAPADRHRRHAQGGRRRAPRRLLPPRLRARRTQRWSWSAISTCEQVEAAIARALRRLAGPARPAPARCRPARPGAPRPDRYLSRPCAVRAGHRDPPHGPGPSEPDTVAQRRANLLRQIGYGIVNRRLQRSRGRANPPFRGAGFGTGDVFEDGRTTNLIVDAVDGEWRQGLAAAARE